MSQFINNPEHTFGFDTLQLHVGQESADPASDSRAVPIYQTTSYVFRNSQHAADRFGLADAGNIYGRLTMSTQGVFEDRIAALEGGVAGLAVASGAAAITYTLQALAQAGDHVVAQKTIYGGSYNLLEHTLPNFGITATFVDAHNLKEIEDAIQENTRLVYLETLGNPNSDIPDLDAIAEIAHKHGVWMHTDAVQAVGAIPVDVKELGVDMLSMSAHKFNGPKGMGALYCRKGIWPQNLIDGGSQEARHRAGTENVAGIAGMGKALEMAVAHLDERMAHEKELRDYVIDRVLKNIPEARLNGGLEHRLPGNANISFPGLEGETILLDLDMHHICASTGSACNSDSLDPSHVLLSIGVPEEIGHGSMRFTFGPQNTMEEAKYLCDVLEEVIPRRRAMSCMWLQGQNTARHFSLKGEN